MYKEGLKQQAMQLSSNPKVQAAGGIGTTISGMGTYLNYIPDALGIVATSMGIILAWIMIRKGRLDARKIKLEIKLMGKEHVCETCQDNRRSHETD